MDERIEKVKAAFEARVKSEPRNAWRQFYCIWWRVQMAMPQSDNAIEEIKRLDALLEYAVMHGDDAEAERLREALRKITESF